MVSNIRRSPSPSGKEFKNRDPTPYVIGQFLQVSTSLHGRNEGATLRSIRTELSVIRSGT